MPIKHMSGSYRNIGGRQWAHWMDAVSDVAKSEAARIRRAGFPARCVGIGEGEHRIFIPADKLLAVSAVLADTEVTNQP